MKRRWHVIPARAIRSAAACARAQEENVCGASAKCVWEYIIGEEEKGEGILINEYALARHER